MQPRRRPASVPLLALLLVAAALVPSLGSAKDEPRTGQWTKVKVRVVELPEGSPALEKLPLLPLAPNTDGRFLFGRTAGWKVAIDEKGLDLTLEVVGAKGAKSIHLAKSGRQKFAIAAGSKSACELPVEFVADGGRWSYRVPAVLEVAGPAGPVLFLDADGDGWFDDLDVDRVAVGAASAVRDLDFKPFVGEVAVKGLRYLAYADVDEGGFWTVSAAVRADYLKHAALVNELRKYAGLDRVGLAEELTPACEAHCRYMHTNNAMTHPEEPGRPGYSVAGNGAGMHSCLGAGEDAALSLTGMLATLWHRNYYLSKSLTRVGVGCVEGYLTSDVMTYGRGTAGRELVFAPPANALDAGLGGEMENPDPYPDGKPLPGPFITVLLPPGKKLPFVAGSITPRGGPPLAFSASDPTNPPAGARQRFPDNDQCIVLIPHEPLAPDTIYDVVVKAGAAAKPQVYQWSFRTRGKGK